MRHTPITLAVAAALTLVAPSIARAQNPQQLLQGLLSGNKNQDQPVRDAFERGYRQGREDQRTADRAGGEGDRRQPSRGGYSDQNQDQNQNQDYQRNQYRR